MNKLFSIKNKFYHLQQLKNFLVVVNDNGELFIKNLKAEVSDDLIFIERFLSLDRIHSFYSFGDSQLLSDSTKEESNISTEGDSLRLHNSIKEESPPSKKRNFERDTIIVINSYLNHDYLNIEIVNINFYNTLLSANQSEEKDFSSQESEEKTLFYYTKEHHQIKYSSLSSEEDEEINRTPTILGVDAQKIYLSNENFDSTTKRELGFVYNILMAECSSLPKIFKKKERLIYFDREILITQRKKICSRELGSGNSPFFEINVYIFGEIIFTFLFTSEEISFYRDGNLFLISCIKNILIDIYLEKVVLDIFNPYRDCVLLNLSNQKIFFGGENFIIYYDIPQKEWKKIKLPFEEIPLHVVGLLERIESSPSLERIEISPSLERKSSLTLEQRERIIIACFKREGNLFNFYEVPQQSEEESTQIIKSE